MSQKTYGQLKAEGQVETLLKKRARDEESRLMSALEKERATQLELKKSRVPTLKSAASFVAGQRNKDKSWKSHLTRMRRARPEIPSDGRLILAIRIQISVNSCIEVKKTLRQLNLTERFTAVLLRCNEATHDLLKAAEPYIAFGYPTLESVEQLLRKRARVHKKGMDVLLKDNNLVEEALGSLGIICLEDLVHEFWSLGPNFEKVNRFLAAFKLNPPANKLKKTAFGKGGDFGNRGEGINELLSQML
jgi:large subunit ribosomal protein L7e